VMFVSPDPAGALQVARDLVTTVAHDDVLEEARAGLDLGDVVPRGGDYFGTTVNVAARITAFARPGTVVVSEAVVDALEGERERSSPIGPKKLKGVGRIRLYKVAIDL
jgi:adenylate cyclase